MKEQLKSDSEIGGLTLSTASSVLHAGGLLAFYGLTVMCHPTVWSADGGPRVLFTALALLFPLVWISVSDLSCREVPDLGAFVVASIGIVQSFWIGFAGLSDRILLAALVSLGLALVGEYVWAKRKTDVLGLGDVKLIGAGILVVGGGSTWIMILLAAVGGVVAGVLMRSRPERGIPFAPFLAYAIFVTFLMTGPPT